jgi:hypothetical protein
MGLETRSARTELKNLKRKKKKRERKKEKERNKERKKENLFVCCTWGKREGGGDRVEQRGRAEKRVEGTIQQLHSTNV